MTIVFICGSFEPGKDGVGDYTRRLAAELMQMGHPASCIAFFDRYVSENGESIQDEQGYSISTLRLSRASHIKQRTALAKQWIDEKNPDWISLQYVPFAFQPKGLPFRLETYLAALGKGRRWHIMFHELWVGMNREASLKEVVWGHIQRLFIRRLLLKLQPHVIHSNTKVYCEQLRILGYKANQLLLFSNIPVDENDKPQDEKNKNNASVSMVVFGGIYPDAPIEEFAQEVALYQKKNKINCSLTILGRSGQEQNRWVCAWEAAGLQAIILGEQSTQNISRMFKSADAGIATTPYYLSEKSGSIAAMREHHLPVISVAKTWQPRLNHFLFRADGVFAYKPGSFEIFLHEKHDLVLHRTASEITHIFIHSLKAKNEFHQQSV